MLEIPIVSSARRQKTDTPTALFLFGCGILASQRFSLPILSAFTPLLIIGGFVLFRRNTERLATFAVCALLAIADLGGEAYFDTPSTIKYSIYLLSIACLLYNFNFTLNKLTAVTIIFAFLVFVLFLLNDERADLYTFVRDIVTISLLIFAVSATSSKVTAPLLDSRLLVAFAAGVLISENINVLLFYDVTQGEYLSYSSSKFICLAPILYFFINRRYITVLALFPLTLIAAIFLGARMIFVSSMVLAILLIIGSGRHRFKSILIAFGAVSLFTAFYQTYYSELQAYRVLSVLSAFEDFYSFQDVLIGLDRIRFYENYVFFNQDIFHLLFGNGFGAGYRDVGGFFNFVQNDGGAFTSDELSERLYFRFHDSWIWFGYRLGLLPFLLCVFWIIRNIVNDQRAVALFSSLAFLALINASFSISGMLVTYFFALAAVQFKHSMARG